MEPNPVELDEDEALAWGDLNRIHSRIRGWGLSANRSELIAAVHVIQGFVVQHMLSRVAPGQWSDWYQDAPQAEGVSEASLGGFLPNFGHLEPFRLGDLPIAGLSFDEQDALLEVMGPRSVTALHDWMLGRALRLQPSRYRKADR